MSVAPAIAYLLCTIQPVKSGPETVQMALDESNQVATVTLPRWHLSSRSGAVFSPDEVLISSGLVQYRVSRTALTIERTTALPAAKPRIDRGTCAVTPTPERAF